MTDFVAHYRHRRDGTLDDTYLDIHAQSKAEAVRIAKGRVGEDDKTWLLDVRNHEATP